MLPILKLARLEGGSRWLRVSAAAVLSGRVPLISFPQRRGQPLSVEHYQQSQPPPPVTSRSVAAASTGDSNFVTINPTMFGRLPLSREEMELINSGGAR